MDRKIILLKAMEDCCQRILSNHADKNYVDMQNQKLEEYFTEYMSLHES